MMENAKYKRYLSLLTLSQDLSCFDVEISTEPIDRWDPFWHPTWKLNGTNCVDKRTYKCEDK